MSRRPILLWPYESAPPEYRAVSAPPSDSSTGMPFVALVPSTVDQSVYWSIRHLLFGAAADCVCTFMASGDVVYVGTVPRLPSLYERLGGAAGIDRLVTRWRERVLADSSLAPRLDARELARHRRNIAAFLSAALGGPPIYDRPDLHEVRRRLRLTADEFERILGHLAEELRDVQASTTTINDVTSALAALKRLLVDGEAHAATRL